MNKTGQVSVELALQWSLHFTSFCLSTPDIHKNTSTFSSRGPNVQATKGLGLRGNFNGTEGLGQIEPLTGPLTNVEPVANFLQGI